jgi:thiol-disulfide isomerase/thioredoxin
LVIRKTLILLLLSSFARADKLEYFDSKIDFWGDKPSTKDTFKKDPSPTEKQDGKFPWKTFLDPKNKEFFKEGDYTPPEPFMEVARNPTDDNIKQWFELMKKKNELQTKLQERMAEYMAKNGEVNVPSNITTAAPALPKAKEQNVALDTSRFRLRMYFESTCPHCRRMFQVLKKLQDGGFHVEALQVDTGPVPDAEKVVPISRADPSDLKKHGIKGVPFLLIADTKRKALLPAIEGYHDYEEILRLLKAAN